MHFTAMKNQYCHTLAHGKYLLFANNKKEKPTTNSCVKRRKMKKPRKMTMKMNKKNGRNAVNCNITAQSIPLDSIDICNVKTENSTCS